MHLRPLQRDCFQVCHRDFPRSTGDNGFSEPVCEPSAAEAMPEEKAVVEEPMAEAKTEEGGEAICANWAVSVVS